MQENYEPDFGDEMAEEVAVETPKRAKSKRQWLALLNDGTLIVEDKKRDFIKAIESAGGENVKSTWQGTEKKLTKKVVVDL